MNLDSENEEWINNEENETTNDEEQELFEHFKLACDPGQEPLRVDKFLSNRIANSSRSKIQSAAEAGNIVVNGKPVKSNYKIKGRDVVSIVLEYPPREIEIIPEDIPLNIVYEDEVLLVVNKPAGLVVHPAYGHYSGTLVNALAFHCRDNDLFTQGNSEQPPGLVHRIDKDTSGLLVVAKTDYARQRLARQFFDKTTHRQYVAVVWGSFEEENGVIEGHVGRSIRDRKVMDVFTDGSQGKHAVTHWHLLERLGYVSVVGCKLETGRTHQIRVHMKHIGHPLFSDKEYGGNAILKGTTFTKYKQFVDNCFKICPRQALHAKTLGFEHPTTGEYLSFDSELPEDMTLLIEKWRGYISGRD